MKGNIWIVSSKKTDGRYNKGKIVGTRMYYPYLSVVTFSQFKSELIVDQYQVAYQDVFTEKFCLEWFAVDELSKDNPTTQTGKE